MKTLGVKIKIKGSEFTNLGTTENPVVSCIFQDIFSSLCNRCWGGVFSSTSIGLHSLVRPSRALSVHFYVLSAEWAFHYQGLSSLNPVLRKVTSTVCAFCRNRLTHTDRLFPIQPPFERFCPQISKKMRISYPYFWLHSQFLCNFLYFRHVRGTSTLSQNPSISTVAGTLRESLLRYLLADLSVPLCLFQQATHISLGTLLFSKYYQVLRNFAWIEYIQWTALAFLILIKMSYH